MTGCASSSARINTTQNLSDVEYSIEQNGDLKLTTSYIQKDGNTTTKERVVDKKKSTYEVVPNFESKYSDNIKLKSNQIKKEAISIRGKKVKLSVESIPLNEFINVVFSSVLKLNYTVDEDVKKIVTPITLNMPELQKREDFFEVVKKLLDMNGVSLREKSGTIFIYKNNQSNQVPNKEDIYIGFGRELDANIPDDKLVLMFVSYHYINPASTVGIYRNAGLSGLRFYYHIKSIQLIKGRAEEVRKALYIADIIDRPFLKDKTTYLVEFEYIEAEAFKKRIKTIFQANSILASSSTLGGGIFMVAIPEINSILLVSPKKSWTEMFMYWKNKLDVESEVSQEPRFFTYKVKHRKADELEKALNSMIDMKLSTQKKDTKEKTTSIVKNPKNYSVVADLPTNSLMLKMTPSQYKDVLPLIEKLDALPLQVLVELTLAEVTMTDTFDLGFEHKLTNDAAKAGASAVSSAASTAITAAFGGKGFLATFEGDKLSSTINAYAEKKLLNILSKPRILILNNETGNINVGQQVPVITSEASAVDIPDGSIKRNIEYRNTGVIVGLTPTINSNGILTMQISINLSEAQLNKTSSIDSPLIVNRTLSTVLTIKSGNTVLLGGLISTNDSLTESGVPFFKDIPLLGYLFKTESDKKVKTELIMLIRPHIVKIPEEMTQKTRKYRKMLNLLNKYILF